jgi:hypothetical protein
LRTGQEVDDRNFGKELDRPLKQNEQDTDRRQH